MKLKLSIATMATVSLATFTMWAQTSSDYNKAGDPGLSQENSSASQAATAQNVREQTMGASVGNSNSTPKDSTLGFSSRTNHVGGIDSSIQNVRDRSTTNSWGTNNSGASVNTWQNVREQNMGAGIGGSNSTPKDDTLGFRDRTNNVDTDNTALNARDRDSQALTPLKQGNSKEDISTTSQIRREIVRNKDISTTAHNVKIITVDGKVTLRGPVNSEEEKRTIAEIAQRLSNGQPVDNQLEVKRNEQ
jgi:hypothetical protein